MKKWIFYTAVFLSSNLLFGQTDKVSVQSAPGGASLMVNGETFIVNGMNWDYFPIGTNYTYSLWQQSGDVIKAALDREMPLLQNMGVNAIRQYTGVPSKWIKYIYENYGIYTILNHSFGRYGLNVNGTWQPNTDYSNPEVRALLLAEVKEMVEAYKGTPGLLMFLLGNENNYGLFWQGAETENIPVAERKSTLAASHMYKLFNDAALEMKGIDKTHPIAICNGDLLFLDIIARECKNVDILGLNVYRGISFGDLFDRVKNEYGKPVMFTEFGADAFNTLTNDEDGASQAKYLLGNWKEIYANMSGMGKAGNCIGGCTFQFSDGWWKSGQTINLDQHDTHASWSNGGYENDHVEGENNMNEEWFGICAKGATNASGLYDLYPRAAYYALKQAHQFNPTLGSKALASHFDQINLADAILRSRGDKAALEAESSKKVRLSSLRADFTTYNTGGSLITTPKEEEPGSGSYPSHLGFDHMESFYAGITANPSPNVSANVQFNILGNVATNPIDEVFYENRGRPLQVTTPNGTQEISANNRVQLYRSSFNWNHKYFDLNGFYRTGHYHWGYEGDFFGLYPEANYGPNIDIYNGEAPFGFEMAGKKALKGLKLAFGPELWWGANPAVLLKYSTTLAKFDVSAIFHEDLAQRGAILSSIAVPQPKTRRASLSLGRKFGDFGFTLGGLWAGQPLNGRAYQAVRWDVDSYQVYEGTIKPEDNYGGKVKLTYANGLFNWYGQGAIRGLVANGGADFTQTFTGWSLKDNGSGNVYNILSGFTVNMGDIQLAPNFLWQRPVEGPIPMDAPAPARLRNILDDPFAVRSNRETIAGEMLITYDPTPGTWMYDWDNDRAEDAKFAMSLGVVYRHLPTSQDAAIGILANGRTTFAFPGAAPAQDLWETNARVVSKLNSDLGLIANIYFGNGQANGSDTRTINRFGLDLRTIYKKIKLTAAAKFNDWGPYDYHRDFNLTFPVQLMADLSTEIGKPDWFLLPSTKIGLRGTFRNLDKYSPRYAPTYTIDSSGELVPDPAAIGFPNGNEWEIRTYIQFNIF
jgi:hypothetical protein